MIGRLKKGDKLIEILSKTLEGKSGSLFAIGALESAEIALYDLSTKEYYSKKIEGPLELANLTAIVAKLPDGKTGIHAHVTMCDKEFNTYSGHLKEATIAATLEFTFFENEKQLERYNDQEIGLNLLK